MHSLESLCREEREREILFLIICINISIKKWFWREEIFLSGEEGGREFLIGSEFTEGRKKAQSEFTEGERRSVEEHGVFGNFTFERFVCFFIIIFFSFYLLRPTFRDDASFLPSFLLSISSLYGRFLFLVKGVFGSI